MSRKKTIVVVVTASAIAIIVVVIASSRFEKDTPCGSGFTRFGARCCPTNDAPIDGLPAGTCAMKVTTQCAPPLSPRNGGGCDVPPNIEHQRVHIRQTSLTIGPSDWEAEGRVAPRSIKTAPFAIDRFEVTVGQLCALATTRSRASLCEKNDSARAAFGIPLGSARAYCARRGGRLPTEDEWLVAAAGGEPENEKKPRRYPWGDTGAVCRRAAFGLSSGPCAEGAVGPDTVGAHHDGATPLGIEDLAGNVAEWVETGVCPNANDPFVGEDRDAGDAGRDTTTCIAIVRGGSWRTNLATELRTWLRREVPSNAVEDGTIGFRCAYSAQ